MATELLGLMKVYARKGLEDWKSAPGSTKTVVLRILANRVATSEWEANNAIEAIREEPTLGRCRFIPMPTVNHTGAKHCFFLPMKAGEGKAAFDLLLFIDGGKWLGFRFEPADAPQSTHGYGHVQLNKVMFRKQIPVEGIPDWLPEHYPAFPIRTSDPLQMFLAMATAVHGYENGMVNVVRELFKSRPSELARYLKALEPLIQ